MRNFDAVNINTVNIKDTDIETVLVPRHKYSFTYKNEYYIGFYRRCSKENDKKILVFNNFSIEIKKEVESCYIYDLVHHKMSPSISKLLEQNRFSDSESDGFDSPNYKIIMEQQNKDEFDDYVTIGLGDVE